MASTSLFDNRSVMKAGQTARLITSMLNMVSKSLQEKEQLRVEENDKKITELSGKKDFDSKSVASLLSENGVLTDSNGVHFGEQVSVVLAKNYLVKEISLAMTDHNVGCIRMAKQDDGMTAILYSTCDEAKMQDALKSAEISLGSSPVVDQETLERMCNARGSDSKICEFRNLNLADTARFEYAASKYSLMMSVSEDTNEEGELTGKYKVSVISSDESKISKVIKDVAILQTSNNAQAFERGQESMANAVKDIADKVSNGQAFYICSSARPDAYLEVDKKGFRVIAQKGELPKEIKTVEGSLKTPMLFNELCNETLSFENPVILSPDEFSVDKEDRLATVVGKMTELEYANEAEIYTGQLVTSAFRVANELNFTIHNASSFQSEKFYNLIEKSNMPNKEEIIATLGMLRNLPNGLVDNAVNEFKDNITELESKLKDADEIELLDNEMGNDLPEPEKEFSEKNMPDLE